MKKKGLSEEYKEALDVDSNLVEHLEKIIENYVEGSFPFQQKCEDNAKALLIKVLETEELKDIHSARSRVKSVESLIGKIIKKKADLPNNVSNDYEVEKYRALDETNYEKIITDLSGIRILVRYPQQCRVVNEWVMKVFENRPSLYIKDWIKGHNDCRGEYIVERPKIYLRSGQSAEDYLIPDYEKTFEMKESERGYSSIHYVVCYDSKFVEIQVRTIYDEAWGECTHDLVYKCQDKSKKKVLERLSECLAVQTVSAESISKYMYEITNEESIMRERKESVVDRKDRMKKNVDTIGRLRIQAEKGLKKNGFDGNVDCL